MDILVDKYMKEIESSEQSNYDKLSELPCKVSLDVFYDNKSFMVDIIPYDLNPDSLEIGVDDIDELHIEVNGVWAELTTKFLKQFPESNREFMTEINKELTKYLNKKGIY